ncbi:MAG: glucoamylase family protein [Candidatus Binatia bacterium]
MAAGTGRAKKSVCPIDEESLQHPQLPPGAREIVIPLKKKAWENAFGGEAAARPYVRNRLVALPQQLLADKNSLPQADLEFVWCVARDTWRGVEALTDRDNGLPVDNVGLGDGADGAADARVGDYTSGTNIGLHLVAIAAAREIQLISTDQAVDKIRRILDSLGRLEAYRGFFFNFYDTTSLERTSNFVSFVDSSWLTAGLMTVRMAFPELHEQCTQLIAQADYGFFYDGVTKQISHGYYVKPGARSPYTYGMLYTEARLGSLIAIGKGDVPEDQWFEMLRTFPTACRWQTQVPKGRPIKMVRGHEVSAGWFEWDGLRYVPSWGGSMFEALMPTLLLDEPRYAAKSLGANDAVQATVQRRYAVEELGFPVWGISSSATPAGDGYSEYGAKVLGARGYDAGAVTPYASALALSVAPEAAIANLRRLAERYEIYGEYGFYDAVDPRSGTVAYKYLSLDQSMLFIALANYLTDHSIQKHFASDPIIQKALPIIADENFFE